MPPDRSSVLIDVAAIACQHLHRCDCHSVVLPAMEEINIKKQDQDFPFLGLHSFS